MDKYCFCQEGRRKGERRKEDRHSDREIERQRRREIILLRGRNIENAGVKESQPRASIWQTSRGLSWFSRDVHKLPVQLTGGEAAGGGGRDT